jgi:hypothetical protein
MRKKAKRVAEGTCTKISCFTLVTGRDGVVRVVDVEYQNHHEKVKRQTRRGVRDLIVIHPIGELGILRELNDLAKSWSGQS